MIGSCCSLASLLPAVSSALSADGMPASRGNNYLNRAAKNLFLPTSG